MASVMMSSIMSRNALNQEPDLDELGESDANQELYTHNKWKLNLEMLISILCVTVLVTFFVYMYITRDTKGFGLEHTIILGFVITLIVTGILLIRFKRREACNDSRIAILKQSDQPSNQLTGSKVEEHSADDIRFFQGIYPPLPICS